MHMYKYKLLLNKCDLQVMVIQHRATYTENSGPSTTIS